MKKAKEVLCGILIGAVNITLGAGGGIIAVPLLKKTGMTQKEAQANAIAIMLPLTMISLIIYFKRGCVNFSDIGAIFPCAAAGALIGTTVFSKISGKAFSIIFALFMIWSGIRLLLK